MSLNYAASLSPYMNKGKVGQPELFDSIDKVKDKCKQLANLIKESKFIVAITGAGLSTSCGIPDFRGPNGIWTLEKKGETPNVNISFEQAIPSYAHFALTELENQNKLNFLMTQNIDGLHHRSGFPLNKLADLHGNMFSTKCNQCQAKRFMNESVKTVGLKTTGKRCTREKQRGVCRGEFCDTILDWEDALPTDELKLSELNCKNADLCLCLGTSLQIMPCGNFPLLVKKHNNGKIVIVNLQATRMDKHADLVINYKLDYVFRLVIEDLNYKMSLSNEIVVNSKHSNQENKSLLLNTDNILTVMNDENKCSYELKDTPNLLLVFTGKRKCGKDYACNRLIKKITSHNNSNILVEILTLSAPLKHFYAQENNLNFEKLMDSSDYKEKYRKDMIEWGEKKRSKDPSYFSQMAVDALKCKVYKNSIEKMMIWIVTDARRHTDLQFFEETYSGLVKYLRVTANEDTRRNRGWVFTDGIDNVDSECNLDDFDKWDFVVVNNSDEELDESLDKILEVIKKMQK